MNKINRRKILLWGLPLLIAGLLVYSFYFRQLSLKGWASYPIDDGVVRLTIDPQGRVWDMGGYPRCAGARDLSAGAWTTYIESNSGLPDNCIDRIAFDTQGRIWIATRGIITVFDGNQADLLKEGTRIANNSFFSGLNIINAIAFDMEGRTWVGSFQGVSIFDGEKWLNFTEYNYEILGPNWNSVLAIALDRQGRPWIRTSRGIIVIEGEDWRTYAETEHSVNPGMFFDPQGRVWITTNRSIQIVGGETITSIISDELPDGYIRTIDFDPQGRAWILFELDNAHESLASLAIYDGNSWTSVLKNEPISCRPVFDPQGRAWICAQNGVWVYQEGKWINYTTDNSGLSHNHVHNIEFDAQGQAWIATEDGVNRASPAEFQPVPSFLASPAIRWLLMGLTFALWLAIHPAIRLFQRVHAYFSQPTTVDRQKEMTTMITNSQRVHAYFSQPTTSARQRFGLGALYGAVALFVTITAIQALVGGFWYPFLLIFSLMGTFLFGVIGGGLSGLIVGRFWKTRYSILLGILLEILLCFPLLRAFGSCALMGGC